MTEIERFVVFFEVHKERAVESLTHMNTVTDQTIGKTEELKESLTEVRELIETPIELSAADIGEPTVDQPHGEIPVEFKYEDPGQKPPVRLPYVPDIREPSRTPETIIPIEDMELRARGIDETDATPTLPLREDILTDATADDDIPATQRDRVKEGIEQAKTSVDRTIERRIEAVNNITQQVENIQNLTVANRNDIRRQSVQQVSQNITQNEPAMREELPDRPEEAVPEITDIDQEVEVQPTSLGDTAERSTEDIGREIEELQRAMDQLRSDIMTPIIQQGQMDTPDIAQQDLPEVQNILKQDMAQRETEIDFQPVLENLVQKLIDVSTDASIQDRRNVINMLNQALELRAQVDVDSTTREGDDVTQITNRLDQRTQQRISYPLIQQTNEIIQTQSEINIINDVVMALQEMTFPGLNVRAEVDRRSEDEIIKKKVKAGVLDFYESWF